MSIRLSSCCRCGPAGSSKHEMGKCPQVLKEVQMIRDSAKVTLVLPGQTVKVTGVTITNNGQDKIYVTGQPIKRPWEK